MAVKSLWSAAERHVLARRGSRATDGTTCSRVRQRSSLFEDIRRALPRHQAQFHTCDTGLVRADDGEIHRQHFGIATLVAPHLALIGCEASFVHGQFAHHTLWPAEDRGRLAHAVRVADGTGRSMTIAHLHGVRMSSGKQDTHPRRRQAERLAALVTRVREAADLVVVAGDLNLLPDSETFEILRGIGLTELVHDTDTRTSAYAKPVRHASYLLVSDPDAVAAFEVPTDPEVSDHRPLVLDLRAVGT